MVGSNIFNVLFILGISAAIVPLAVARQVLRVDVPIMIGTSLLLVAVGLGSQRSRSALPPSTNTRSLGRAVCW